ncbi:DUF692 domain-containing protein [Sulfidibacter corallicola]|uniref:DUF692 domain-containing protein n=1 Tax=Sulfidibacter corallicola TaxID=2818388 RepID=A0A8A4TM29_SULCO|nr:DUF692 domain-containing protein [Sulfidibacter corallicola]QTD50264.1 DUF692 domain-containing protein [Sulfidibacter corallicola]
MVRNNALGLPNLGLGVGLRHAHFSAILENGPQIDFFEIISENFLDHHGYARHVLERLRGSVPMVMHGVSLSIGSADPLNWNYLHALRDLAGWLKPAWISDHLCWTGYAGINSHDLLPLPYTPEVLAHVADRIKAVQDFLGRPLILENPSSYLAFGASTLPEWAFLNALVTQTDCGLLLDINNIYVSAFNLGFDPEVYLREIALDHVVQIHLAGPSHNGDHLVDTHDHPVPPRVWALYRWVTARTGPVSTLLEWDASIPEYADLLAEIRKANPVGAPGFPEPMSLCMEGGV